MKGPIIKIVFILFALFCLSFAAPSAQAAYTEYVYTVYDLAGDPVGELSFNYAIGASVPSSWSFYGFVEGVDYGGDTFTGADGILCYSPPFRFFAKPDPNFVGPMPNLLITDPFGPPMVTPWGTFPLPGWVCKASFKEVISHP